jgi:hypothetical protein
VSGSLLVIFVLSFRTGGRCSGRLLSASHFFPVCFFPVELEGVVVLGGCLLVIFVRIAFLKVELEVM